MRIKVNKLIYSNMLLKNVHELLHMLNQIVWENNFWMDWWIDWLIDWLVGWLIDDWWSIDWLAKAIYPYYIYKLGLQDRCKIFFRKAKLGEEEAKLTKDELRTQL